MLIEISVRFCIDYSRFKLKGRKGKAVFMCTRRFVCIRVVAFRLKNRSAYISSLLKFSFSGSLEKLKVFFSTKTIYSSFLFLYFEIFLPFFLFCFTKISKDFILVTMAIQRSRDQTFQAKM